MSYIEYTYVYIKYIKSKSKSQNCQVENNMKIIFSTEKFKSLAAMLCKLNDHGKAASISTRNFPLSKTIKINYRRCSYIFWVGCFEFLFAEECLKQNDICLQHWKYQLVILFGRANPASTATLWQRCHNVVVDVVTTLWHGRKWELYRRQFPTLWQRRSPTLSRRCLNVATTSPQH